MKKSVTKVNKIKKDTFVPNTRTAHIDISNINTDNEMVYNIAVAKINAGRSIDTSEFMNMISNLEYSHNEFINRLIRDAISVENKLSKKIADLEKKLNEKSKHWYNKLLFWKKKPVYDCSKACC